MEGGNVVKNSDLRDELKSIIENADFTREELKLLIEKAKEIMDT